MQTANALNNIIRILFNPKIEAFKLFDFLIVKSVDTRYLAQIVEIYDDKFDSSQNVAKIKMFYKISENNEVMPYDNFTPNKECEIIKIKQEEVENFINSDKETFIFATNAKNQMSLNIQYDFFNNNPIVLADKIENANVISLNIAKKLSEKKHAIIIDSTGVIEHDCAKKIIANKDIKIPLNFSTVDFVFDKCISNSSLEFQVAAGPIINEIKNFSKKQSLQFIPFNAFLRVILEQYKATPYPELKTLIIGLKKFQMNEIFAHCKKDVENLHKAIEKNPVTIIDISTVDTFWQKAYLEYLTDAIEENIYLISRINDENCDTDFINKIYCKKQNINFIPTVSYNYKKLPSIMQFCKNYILLPSLYQRNDFLDANFALSNLISDGCVLFGENADNFLYIAKDYELAAQEKRKNYKKIVLSLSDKSTQEELASENLGEKGDYFENQKKAKLEIEQTASNNNEKENFTEIQNPTPKNGLDEFDEIISKTNSQSTIIEDDTTENKKETINETEPKEEIKKQEEPISLESLESVKSDANNEDNLIIDIKEEIKKQEEPVSLESFESVKSDANNEDDLIIDIKEEIKKQEENKTNNDEDILTSELGIKSENSEIKDEVITENTIKDSKIQTNEIEIIEFAKEEVKKEQTQEVSFDDILKEENKNDIELKTDEFVFAEDTPIQTQNQNKKEEANEESTMSLDDIFKVSDDEPKNNTSNKNDKKDDLVQNDSNEDILAGKNTEELSIQQAGNDDILITDSEINADVDSIDLSEEELDFFQMAQEDEDTKENSKGDFIDLSQAADSSVDSSFEDIVNNEAKTEKQTINVDNNTKLDEDLLNNTDKKENLPIFKEEIKKDNTKEHVYQVGEKVTHGNYGNGVVVKIIKYEGRQLLQIDFEKTGKKTLEPRIANVKPLE